MLRSMTSAVSRKMNRERSSTTARSASSYACRIAATARRNAGSNLRIKGDQSNRILLHNHQIGKGGSKTDAQIWIAFSMPAGDQLISMWRQVNPLCPLQIIGSNDPHLKWNSRVSQVPHHGRGALYINQIPQRIAIDASHLSEQQ